MSIALIRKTDALTSLLPWIGKSRISHLPRPLIYGVVSFLVLVMGIFQLREGLSIDEMVSNSFFFSESTSLFPKGHWLFPKSDPDLTFWLHTVFNSGFILVGITCSLLIAASFFTKSLVRYRYAAFMVVTSIILVSASVAVLKAHSERYCPSKMVVYGGEIRDDYKYFPLTETERRHADCFAAAHPAPGFALMILGVIAGTRQRRLYGYLTGMAMGTILSLIQIARGEHFLSHCLATFLIALWLVHIIPQAFDFMAQKLRPVRNFDA